MYQFCRIENDPKLGQILLRKVNDSESDQPVLSIEFITPDSIRLSIELKFGTDEDRDEIFDELKGETLIERIESIAGSL